MIHTRPLSIDAERRIKVAHEHDAVTGKSRIITVQDVDPILDDPFARFPTWRGR